MVSEFPRNRAPASGIHLNESDAALVKGMLARGDRQHDIAAWFGVNGGRIAEVANGTAFADVPRAPMSELPSPGPYPSGRAASEALFALGAARAALASAEGRIRHR